MKTIIIAALSAVAMMIPSQAIYADLYAAGEFTGEINVFDSAGNATTFATGLSTPTGVVLDAANNVYVASNGDGTITKFTTTGEESVFASALSGPQALAIDGRGNIYEADGGSGAIFKFTPDGAQSTFAPPLSIPIPIGLAFDSAGNLFVTAHADGTVRKIAPDGTITTFISGLNNPIGIAIDGSDNVFVADNFNDRIVKITPAGVLSVFASNIRAGALAFDTQDNEVYAGDNSDNSIVLFDSTGTESAFVSFDHVGGLAFGPPPGTVSPASATLRNISTRLEVLTGNNVGIVGFIVQGNAAKKVIIRGLGPSLADPPFNVPGVLANPTLSLHTSDDQGNDIVVATNDNWKINDATGQSEQAEIEATNLAPSNDLESAIVMTLDPGAYTAILSGKDNGTGNALVEVYDLDEAVSSSSFLANISTRGFVDTGDMVMIGGVIIGPDTDGSATVVLRALGPTLSNPPFNITGALNDPVIELHDGNGDTIAQNDDWQQDSESDQIPESLQPGDAKESALHRTLAPGAYTAIVSGSNGTTGVGLVEVYYLSTP